MNMSMIYLIARAPKLTVSAKFPTREDADGFREKFPDLDLIEVGWLSYALMRRNLPTLAMLPFWR